MNRCATPNCERSVPWDDQRFCEECFAVVLRTGAPPELAREPEWLRRSRSLPHGLARDETGKVAA